MRLRKNMKRTAAAVLALSMAVSAVAAPASAAYICDVSKGNVEISVDESGNKSIKVGDAEVKDNGDGKDEIIITGDDDFIFAVTIVLDFRIADLDALVTAFVHRDFHIALTHITDVSSRGRGSNCRHCHA